MLSHAHVPAIHACRRARLIPAQAGIQRSDSALVAGIHALYAEHANPTWITVRPSQRSAPFVRRARRPSGSPSFFSPYAAAFLPERLPRGIRGRGAR